MSEIVIFLVVAALAAAIGLGFGIVILAPRIGRLLDRADRAESNDEEPGDRPA